MGDKETRIDADASGTVLICTVMSEKETAILGSPGKAELVSGSQIFNYLKEEEAERYVGTRKCAQPELLLVSKFSSAQDVQADLSTSPRVLVSLPSPLHSD